MSASVAGPLAAGSLAPYRIESINRADAPPGCDGEWHSYVILQGANTITGTRAGTRVEVVRLLDEMIDRLNERQADKPKRRSK